MKKAVDFLCCTSDGKQVRLSEKVMESSKTLLIFSRYVGCPFCQVDILELCEQYERFREKNTQILLVLQSTAESVCSYKNNIPFTVICDPSAELYTLYDIKTAKSTLGMINPLDRKLWKKAKKLLQLKLKHGAYEGNEQQLPAIFLLSHNMDLIFRHQAKSISDLPDTDDILKLL